MKSVFLFFIGLILFSCSEENINSKNQLKPEGSIKESPVNTIKNYTNLSGKYYCLKFNIIDELLFTKTKPRVEDYNNLYQFDFKKNGQVEFKNLIQLIGCGNGMLAMDSVLFYPSVDSTFMFEFVGKIYAYNKFHVRNTYKIKQIDSNNFKLINLNTEERLKTDSLNNTDSYGMRQGKWITSRHYENNYLNLIKQTSSNKQSIYYTGVISGKAIQTSNYKFEVTFLPIKPSLTFDAYQYGFKQNSVKHINGNIVLNKIAYQCYSLTAPKHKDSFFSNIIKSKTKAKSFFKSGKKQNEYNVQFTSSEILFLKKSGNFLPIN